MNDNYAIINGEFILQSEAKLLISDLSVQRGYGIFDFLKTLDYQPVFLDDHLDRFYFSAAEMNFKIEVKKEQLKALIHQLIEKNNLPDSGIRITLTGGYSEDGYSLADPNLLITQAPFKYDENSFKKGIHLITYEHQRQLPHVKTIDYIYAIYLQRFIKEHDADEVLYHHQSEITECPRANFFLVTPNNEVITPAKNILKGITRKKILECSQFNIKEGTIGLRDIENAKEAFITSTTKYVLPVLKIDGNPVGDGNPGKITAKISRLLVSLFN
jgi:D-alanine transaminase/branched-chain amino acid aminotransferase